MRIPSVALVWSCFVLTASDSLWFVFAAGYQVDVDSSWLVFSGVILRLWQDTQSCTNYYSSLTLFRDSFT